MNEILEKVEYWKLIQLDRHLYQGNENRIRKKIEKLSRINRELQLHTLGIE